MSPGLILILLSISCLLCGIVGMICAHPSRKSLGLLLGILFGPIGILIAAVLRPLAVEAAPAPGSSTSRPTVPASAYPELPDEFLIRRGTDHYGPYTLDALLTHLAEGTLLPTDQYRTPAGHWARLSRTGLI